MTDPAPPLTEAELDEYARLVLATQLATERGREATHQAIDEYQSFTEKHGGDFEAFMVVIKMAQRAVALESELAQLRAFIGRVSGGGTIVSTAAMTPAQIAIARAAERMFVTPDGLGFVHVPGPLTASEQDELTQLRQTLAQITDARQADGERIGKAETELAQLRREKAERGAWISTESRLPEHDVFVAVLYLRGGALVPSVARLTQLGWVTPQAIAVDALYWAPLPPIPERP